jgi:hypothetical protein
MTTRRELLIGAASIAAAATGTAVAAGTPSTGTAGTPSTEALDTELTTGGVGGWQYVLVSGHDNRVLYGIRVDGTTFCSCCETKGEILSQLVDHRDFL